MSKLNDDAENEYNYFTINSFKGFISQVLITSVLSGLAFALIKALKALEDYPVISYVLILPLATFVIMSLLHFIIVLTYIVEKIVKKINDEFNTRNINSKPFWNGIYSIGIILLITLFIYINIFFFNKIFAAKDLTKVIFPIIFVSSSITLFLWGIYQFLKEQLISIGYINLNYNQCNCVKSEEGHNLLSISLNFSLILLLGGGTLFAVIKIYNYIIELDQSSANDIIMILLLSLMITLPIWAFKMWTIYSTKKVVCNCPKNI